MKSVKTVYPLKKGLSGRVEIPPDKSISHRAAMFGALCGKEVNIENFSLGADCLSTLSVLKALGTDVKFLSERNLVISAKEGLKRSSNILDAGNSGTTLRLMSGILSAQNFKSEISGDESLTSRPMRRIMTPLRLMGANIISKNTNDRAPLVIEGSSLKGIEYVSPISSAQVKSCVLLAGLFADGKTSVEEPYKSRDHTERMLKYLGADIKVEENKVSIIKSVLEPRTLKIPGDISSAAFFMVAAAVIPDSEVVLENVVLNPTRTGIIEVLESMNADISLLNYRIECEEEVGDVVVRFSNLKSTEILGEMIPKLIDEIPVIAVLATQAEGKTVIKDAQDLKNKESDRLKATFEMLKSMDANITLTENGFEIEGKTQLKGNCRVQTFDDHRIAMSAYIAGLIADSPIEIEGFESINISFPEFENKVERLKNG